MYTLRNFILACFVWLIFGAVFFFFVIMAEKRIEQKEIKTEYKLEIINQTEVKVYSVSNDTTYITTIDKLVEAIEKDNL